MGQQNPLAATVARTSGSTTQQQLSVGNQGDLSQSALHGSKYLANYTGNYFVGANQSGVTTSAALATTYVGICISNPIHNTNNLVIRRVSGLFVVAPAAETAIGLILGYSSSGLVTHSNPLSIVAAAPGVRTAGGTSTAKLDAACTLVGTPVWITWLAVTVGATSPVSFSVDLEGAIVVGPGGYAAIGTSIAGPTSGFLGSIDWEEWPQ